MESTSGTNNALRFQGHVKLLSFRKQNSISWDTILYHKPHPDFDRLTFPNGWIFDDTGRGFAARGASTSGIDQMQVPRVCYGSSL
jgi:hypothetical protein